MIDCSVSYTDNTDGPNGVNLQKGKIYVSSLNFSHNKIYYDSFNVNSKKSSNPSDCLITHSNFADNSIKDWVCVGFYGKGPAEMKTCNVINNSQGSSEYGAIHARIKLDVYYTCIINNSIPYSFSINSEATVCLYNTTYERSFFTDKGGTVTVCTRTTYRTENKFFFIKTAECDAENVKMFGTTRMKRTLNNARINRKKIIGVMRAIKFSILIHMSV